MDFGKVGLFGRGQRLKQGRCRRQGPHLASPGEANVHDKSHSIHYSATLKYMADIVKTAAHLRFEKLNHVKLGLAKSADRPLQLVFVSILIPPKDRVPELKPLIQAIIDFKMPFGVEMPGYLDDARELVAIPEAQAAMLRACHEFGLLALATYQEALGIPFLCPDDKNYFSQMCSTIAVADSVHSVGAQSDCHDRRQRQGSRLAFGQPAIVSAAVQNSGEHEATATHSEEQGRRSKGQRRQEERHCVTLGCSRFLKFKHWMPCNDGFILTTKAIAQVCVSLWLVRGNATCSSVLHTLRKNQWPYPRT